VDSELIVAEVDERRPVRQASLSSTIKTDGYAALIEQLNKLPQDSEVLSTPVQGYSSFSFMGIYSVSQKKSPLRFSDFFSQTVGNF